MFARALSLATRRAVGSTCRSVGGRHQFRPSNFAATPAAASPTSHLIRHGARRSISASPPLQSSTTGDEGGEEEEGEEVEEPISEDKRKMIERWMKWNTAKSWKYEPNRELIAQIGKEGTTSPLDQFRDTEPREKREAERVGRQWRVNELRRKSYEDLHKLWYVLYKERNMLLTEANLARRHGYILVQPERRKKVRKSMSAVKRTLGERKQRKIADHAAYLEELERFNGLMAKMKLKRKEDDIEEAMDSEAENIMITTEKL